MRTSQKTDVRAKGLIGAPAYRQGRLDSIKAKRAGRSGPRDGDGDGILNEGRARKADLVADLKKAAPDNHFIELAAEIAQLPPELWDAAVTEQSLGIATFLNSPHTIAKFSG